VTFGEYKIVEKFLHYLKNRHSGSEKFSVAKMGKASDQNEL
jgi:hypothetical protein